jgi:hypothetical protein
MAMLETYCALGPWLGTAGDVITFLASVLLAYDAIHQAAQFKEVQAMTKVVEAHELRMIRIKVKGMVAKDHDAVEYAYVRRSSGRALWGTIILGIGFGFLLAGRIVEMVAK